MCSHYRPCFLHCALPCLTKRTMEETVSPRRVCFHSCWLKTWGLKLSLLVPLLHSVTLWPNLSSNLVIITLTLALGVTGLCGWWESYHSLLLELGFLGDSWTTPLGFIGLPSVILYKSSILVTPGKVGQEQGCCHKLINSHLALGVRKTLP